MRPCLDAKSGFADSALPGAGRASAIRPHSLRGGRSVESARDEGPDRIGVEERPDVVVVLPQAHRAKADDDFIASIAVEVGDDEALAVQGVEIGPRRGIAIDPDAEPRPEIAVDVACVPLSSWPPASTLAATNARTSSSCCSDKSRDRRP